VANLNAKDNSFSLKEHLFKDIQKDWPGYTEIDRQVLEIRLSRKSASSQNATSTSHLTPRGPSDTDAPSRTSEKRPLDSNFTFPVVSKKQRIGRLASRVQPAAGGLSPASSTLPPTVLPTSNTSETVSSIFPCTSEVQQKDMPQTPFGIPAPAPMQGESPKPREKKEDRKRLKTSQPLDFTEGINALIFLTPVRVNPGEKGALKPGTGYMKALLCTSALPLSLLYGNEKFTLFYATVLHCNCYLK
ncbi:RNA polymerase II elongation factor ELL2-like, partial [Corapipo altera]|uniref:RNA polymerase II elongation factor ELL2-like n=1 Tax=Corapipo altera TaxID=415028 RepID=UPI000FD64328